MNPLRDHPQTMRAFWGGMTLGLLGAGIATQTLLTPRLWGWGLLVSAFVVGCATRQLIVVHTPLDWPLGCLAAMGAIALWATAFPEITQVQVQRLWACLVGFYGLRFWANTRSRIQFVAAGSAILGVALASLTPLVITALSQSKVFFLPSRLYTVFPRILSDPVHPNIMASALVLLFTIPLAWALASPQPAGPAQRRLKIAGWCAAFWMGAVLIFTQSRGGYIAATVGLLAILWLTGRHKLASLLLIIAVGSALWLFSTGGQAVPENLEATLDPNTFAFRLQVWQAANWVIQDFPFTGVGMGTFNEVTPLLYPFYETQNPGTHNIYLQVGVDLGLPGLIAYLALWSLVLWNAWQTLRRYRQGDEPALSALVVGGAAGVLALLAHGLVDNTMWNTRAAFLPWLVAAWLTALAHGAHTEATEI